MEYIIASMSTISFAFLAVIGIMIVFSQATREMLSWSIVMVMKGYFMTSLIIIATATVTACAVMLATGNIAEFAIIAWLGVVVLGFGRVCPRTTGEQTASVVYCGGQLIKGFWTRESGTFLLPPFIRLKSQPTQEIPFDIDAVLIPTRGDEIGETGRYETGAAATADSSVNFQIVDFVKFAEILGFKKAFSEEILNALRATGGEFTIEEIPLQKIELARAIRRHLDEPANGVSTAARWGIKIIEPQVSEAAQPKEINDAIMRIAVERNLAKAEMTKLASREAYVTKMTALGVDPNTSLNNAVAEAGHAARTTFSVDGLAGTSETDKLFAMAAGAAHAFGVAKNAPKPDSNNGGKGKRGGK